ncbi:MAG: adenylate/guanylate cyclase domain-containing protein [Chloroflexota bacterium]
MNPRSAVWAFHLALPLLGLWLLLAQPAADLTWKHPPSHFVLINAVAAINVGLALLIGRAAGARHDGRLFMASMAFLSSAAFFGIHGLATPGVLVEARGAGFVLSAPVGMAIGGLFALASVFQSDAGAPSLTRHAGRWLIALGLVVAAWAVASVLVLPPLDQPIASEDASPVLIGVAAVTVPLYLLAAAGYFRLYRRRPSVVTVGVITAWFLLAEAMIAAVFGRTWQLSWWEWHLLLLAGYGFVAYSAYVRYRREGSAAGLFNGIALEQTVREIQSEYEGALRELLDSLRLRVTSGREVETAPAIAAVQDRFELTERQAELLGPTADLFREIDDLFLSYTSPQVASALWRDPGLARLGGRSYPAVTVLFADLRGFTSYSEVADREDLFGMLNAYFAAAVPIVLERKGTLDKFVGDALMALFNAPDADPDHALHAASAALAIQAACADVARDHPEWPRFRIGLNSGPVLVGNVGSEQLRNFTAIGDAVNLASRLQGLAEPGQVVIGEATYELIRDVADVHALEPVAVKGKLEPVSAYVLTGLRAGSMR